MAYQYCIGGIGDKWMNGAGRAPHISSKSAMDHCTRLWRVQIDPDLVWGNN